MGPEQQPPHVADPVAAEFEPPAPVHEPDLTDLAERGFRTALGLASLSAAVLAEGLARSLGAEPEAREGHAEEEEPPRRALPTIAGASLLAALEAARLGAQMVSSVTNSVVAWSSFATGFGFVRHGLDRGSHWVADLDDRWRAEQQGDLEAGAAFLETLLPGVVEAILRRLDLTQIVLTHVDLNRVVAAVDLDAVLDDVDLNEVIARVDVGAIVDRIDLAAIVDRIDIDRVAERIDVNAIVGRLPLGAIATEVLNELDLAAIANQVIDDIDLPQIVRESTGTMADETVEGLRAQGMGADRAVSGFVDRLLRRNGHVEG